ncbi:MAG: tRNA (guanosine(18)-2'-O)-methyltransferase [Chlamydiae bacterium]|nr:tRNA (guanosine(18)-2'-O)-methyltransferase [Chlamydiota bacterium]
MLFTQRKFLSFPIARQHKKICELLKEFYLTRDQNTFKTVLQLESWMHCLWTSDESHSNISNSFHRHFKETGLGISEHDFLVKKKDRAEAQKDWLDAVIYLDRLRSAHNIGNIVRTIEAFRLGKLCFSPQMPNLLHPAVQKTSMGSHSYVQTIEKNISELPKPLIVFETHHKAQSLDTFTFPKKFTLVMGNEEDGVSNSIIERADHIVEVPLVGCKNSLNVAACFSIIAWKIREDGKPDSV